MQTQKSPNMSVKDSHTWVSLLASEQIGISRYKASLQLVQIQFNHFINKSNGKTSSSQSAIFEDSMTCKDIPLALFVPEVMYQLQFFSFLPVLSLFSACSQRTICYLLSFFVLALFFLQLR